MTQLEGSLRNRSTWLVDLAVVKLIVVGSILIVFMKILHNFYAIKKNHVLLLVPGNR